MAKFDLLKSTNFSNLMYYKYFFIIRCISHKSIIFSININVTASLFKFCSTFDYEFFC